MSQSRETQWEWVLRIAVFGHHDYYQALKNVSESYVRALKIQWEKVIMKKHVKIFTALKGENSTITINQHLYD